VPQADSQHRKGVALIIAAAAAVVWSTAPFFTRLLSYDSWTILFWRGKTGQGAHGSSRPSGDFQNSQLCLRSVKQALLSGLRVLRTSGWLTDMLRGSIRQAFVETADALCYSFRGLD
jgi:hypothetical protein